MRIPSIQSLAIAGAMLAATAPASAITPFSVTVGGQVPTQSSGRAAGGDLQSSLGVNYDFGVAPIVPIRASFQFDDANGSRGNGKLEEIGFGVAVRLTTPLYVGAGISVYHTDAKLDGVDLRSVSSTSIGAYGCSSRATRRFATLVPPPFASRRGCAIMTSRRKPADRDHGAEQLRRVSPRSV